MEPFVQEALVTGLAAFLTASAGYWAHLRSRTKISDDTREALVALLMGLTQNKIVCEGLKYIERGWITKDEYEDLERYLFRPYQTLGGNGTAEKVMHAVERLPFRSGTMREEIAQLPIRETDLAAGKSREPFEGEDRRA